LKPGDNIDIYAMLVIPLQVLSLLIDWTTDTC